MGKAAVMAKDFVDKHQVRGMVGQGLATGLEPQRQSRSVTVNSAISSQSPYSSRLPSKTFTAKSRKMVMWLAHWLISLLPDRATHATLLFRVPSQPL